MGAFVKILRKVGLFGLLTMVFASCTTMRYEKFDDGLSQDDDPWTEKEIALKEELWSDATVIEAFDDETIESILTDSPGVEKEIIDGILHVSKTGESDGLFIIGAEGTQHEMIALCLRSSGTVYLSSHTVEGGHFQYDVEPTIFLNVSSTSVTNYTQSELTGDYTREHLYHSDSESISKWTVIEFRNTDEGLVISRNGDRLSTADIEGRPFPGVWFHLAQGNREAEIDYILIK